MNAIRRNPRKFLAGCFSASALLIVSSLLLGSQFSRGYIAHEWGTFTSVQSGDGTLLNWHPLESSELPSFVYDWTKAGRNRQPVGLVGFTKARLSTLQRMETPVIYFYSPQDRTVDVTVDFPAGAITEWFPQAQQIGPAIVQPGALIGRLDGLVHRAGVKGDFSFTQLFSDAASRKSKISWRNVEILTPATLKSRGICLPSDASGSHYFAARDTDANPISVPLAGALTNSSQYEKFLFYRGVGNFRTPLVVKTISERDLLLENRGDQPLRHLFVLVVRDGTGAFVYVDGVSPGQTRSVRLPSVEPPVGLEPAITDLTREMAYSLMEEGLYRKEAEAMVSTWRDSWFAEDGLRVLYVLPRKWTDSTLPLNLVPAPETLVRVMVGRAEVLSPAAIRELARVLSDVAENKTGSTETAEQQLRAFGRFAEPALNLALEGATPNVQERAWELLHAAFQNKNAQLITRR